MTRGAQRVEEQARPTVAVWHCGNSERLRQVCAGIEEEGVPFDLVERATDTTDESSARLAHLAATSSVLRVGVGIDAQGGVAVHQSALPAGSPLISVGCDLPAASARAAGHDAARLVVGLPLKSAHPQANQNPYERNP